MKSMYKFMLVILISLFAVSNSGCSTLGLISANTNQYVINSTATVSALVLLKKQFEYAVKVVEANKEKFSEAEIRDLMTVKAVVALLIEKLDASVMFKNTSSIDDITYMWALATEAYVKAKTIVQQHWSEFSEVDQMLLNSFDNQAVLTNDKMLELMRDPTTQNISQMVSLVTSLATISAHLLAAF